MPEASVDEVAHHGERRTELTLESSTMALHVSLAFLLGIARYAAGRTGGTTRLRSSATGLIVLALGVGVALAKNARIGH